MTTRKIAATGHRPPMLGGYGVRSDLEDFAAAKLHQYIEQLTDGDKVEIITGMALGWDQAMATAALRNHVPFHAYIPFPGQARLWPYESQEYYDSLLRHASTIRFTREWCLTSFRDFVDAMYQRNKDMVNDATEVWALLDPQCKKGGTLHCVRYAESIGRPVTRCWNAWLAYKLRANR